MVHGVNKIDGQSFPTITARRDDYEDMLTAALEPEWVVLVIEGNPADLSWEDWDKFVAEVNAKRPEVTRVG
jgi:hypothetical protein